MDSSVSYTGGGIAAGENLYLFNCGLSEVAVFNYALSQTECEEIYAARAVW